MPDKEPLTKAKTGWRGQPTGDVELTGRARAKLQGQISQAKRIMRTEEGAGRRQSKTYTAARKMQSRAQKLLGKEAPPKKADTGDKHEKRRRPIEKATGVHKMRKALEAVGRAGLKKNGG